MFYTPLNQVPVIMRSFKKNTNQDEIHSLGGGFNIFKFSTLLGEMIQFDE